jgi:hypothetical protein
VRAFTVKEKHLKKTVKSRAEFLDLQEDNNTVKADFQDSGLMNFCKKGGLGYLILCDRAFKLLIHFVTMYCCETGFSIAVSGSEPLWYCCSLSLTNKLELPHLLF